MDLVSRDVISVLPNPLISHILSFLSTKEAASTSVLSKKWRYLFGSVTNLDFDLGNQERDEIPTSFMEFVDRVLSLQGNGTVNRFSLTCCGDGVDPARITCWILNVLKRGVSDLDLSLSELEYPLPSELFVSKTLVKLKLGQGDGPIFTFDVEDVFLPKLKYLCLDSLVFEEVDVGFAKLLSGCPVVEELILMNIGWDFWKSCSVSIATLKRLRFFCEDVDENPKTVSFDTPNLVYLEYSDTIAKKYPKVSFNSLIEAHIGLRLTEDQSADANFSEDDYFSDGEEEKEMVGNATDFLTGIRNVRILFLSAEALEVLTFCCEATPVFNNLIQLTIESNLEIGWEALPGLLMNCPSLETLVIKGLDHKRNDGCGNVCCCKRLKNVPSCLSSSPVKLLKIFMFGHIDGDRIESIGQIKYFLEKMPRLEQLIVYFNTSSDHDVFQLSKKLQKIPKIASPKCKIQVISENVSLSSTLPSSLTTNWSAPKEERYTWFLSPLS